MRFLLVCLTIAPLWAGEITGSVTVFDHRNREVKLKPEDPVVVYLDTYRAEIPAVVRDQQYIMSTKDKQFSPRLMIVPEGATVLFPNNDPIIHNVFSVSGKNRFDVGRYGRGEGESHTFIHPGFARIYCNVHHEMNAAIMITANPHFAVVAADGSFHLKGVPPGTYTVKALHRLAGQATAEIVVADGGPTSIDLTIKARRKRLKPHLNKEGKPYSRRKRRY